MKTVTVAKPVHNKLISFDRPSHFNNWPFSRIFFKLSRALENEKEDVATQVSGTSKIDLLAWYDCCLSVCYCANRL